MYQDNPVCSPVWKQLQAHYRTLSGVHMRDLFARDKQRFTRFSLHSCGLLLDYSKNRVTGETLVLLGQLATDMGLIEKIQAMFDGEKINNTEDRAVLHTALRKKREDCVKVNTINVMPDVYAVLDRMRVFTDKVRQGEWLGYTGKSINTIVNIGIGGSDLGPKMVVRALRGYDDKGMRAYFVSNLDATQLTGVLAEINPETTLFVIASKTFSTQETLTNALSARNWLVQKAGVAAVGRHFVAVSTNRDAVREFGIDPDNMFGFWDWVGGRYSLWSAIGLPIALSLGMPVFEELLGGARIMDEHFATAPAENNMPVILALLGLWYTDFFNARTQVILPYDYALEYLPAYLQQLEMESNGKRVRRNGETVEYPTCPVIWGAPGNNGQHAFYQLIHQGTQMIPADFLVAVHTQKELPSHQSALLSNALAQSRALMLGRTQEETAALLEQNGLRGEALKNALPHRIFPGNQPSNTIIYEKLTPAILGSLIALYEHKVFVQGVCWHINSFDQWGVELGKDMARGLLSAIEEKTGEAAYDASTVGLLDFIRRARKP